MKNNKRFLYYVLIILLFNQIISQNYEEIEKDKELCSGSAYNNNCTSIKLNSGVFQCCNYKVFAFYSCQTQMTPISSYKKQIENKDTKALLKEIYGYEIYNENSQSIENYQLKYEYNCKDGNVTLLFGNDTYTDDEIKVLKSENHCLKYFNNISISVSKEDCFNSVLTQNAKDEGLSCGLIEFTVKYRDDTLENIKSCFIFNKNARNYETIDDITKFLFSEVVEKKTYTNYTAELTDESGNKLVYDSKTEKLSSNFVTQTVSDEDDSQFALKFSKYFMLLIILLL